MSKLKRIALVQPPRRGKTLSVPVGLLSLASYIKPFGYLPIIIDLNIYITLEQKYPSDFFQQAAKKILSYDPQILGFTVMCNTFPSALLIAEECKKLAPHLPIIFGGPEVSFEEVQVLETFKQVDIVVRGEGEITLVEVLGALEKKRPLSDILGITFREGGQVIRNLDRPFIENLDNLPFFDYSLLPNLENYLGKGEIEAGRGCPFQCTFCSTCKMWKRKFRMKSPQRLVQEIKQAGCLSKKNGKLHIGLTHDNFLASRKVVEEFLSLIAHENFAWTCSCRLEALDESLIKELKQTGCQAIFLGIESGSPEMQKEIKKNLPLDRLPRVLKLLKENEIKTTLSFIIGFPSETESQINQTLLMALNSKLSNPSLNIQISFFRQLKGSELYADTKDKFGAAEFWATDISPLATALPAETKLIKKHPHIFPSFYCLKDKRVPSELLQKVHLFFVFLVDFLPRTASLLLEILSLTPFQLCQKIIYFFEEQNADKAYTGQNSLSFHDFTALIAFIVHKSHNQPQLMKLLAEELYELQCYGGKLSDYLTVVPHNDEYILAQGALGKILVIKKKLFDEVVNKLYMEGSQEVEKTKKRLIEMLVIVSERLEEPKLVRSIFNDQAERNVISNKKCLKCKHISFCVRPASLQIGKDASLCGDNFKSFLQKNFDKIKETAASVDL